MAILKRVGLGRALTHPEMDENFSSVYFSSSLQNNANTLRLYYDTAPLSYVEVPLNAGSSIGIINYANNRLVTATASPNIIEGQVNFTYDGSVAAIGGRLSLVDSKNNLLIGTNSGLGVFNKGNLNTIIGGKAGEVLIGNYNVLVGYRSAVNAQNLSGTVAVGMASLENLGTGTYNVALGDYAGQFLEVGSGNVYIGFSAGPDTAISEDNQLYINNSEGTPLIGGDFSNRTVSLDGALTVSQNVNAVSFTGSFKGNGSGLTGIPSTGWDGIRNGNAQITGSLVVSGSGAVVNLTNTVAISGSIFSGSFVGNGSGLTGVTGEWDGSRNGNAQLTGSFTVSGSLLVTDTLTISSKKVYSYPGVNIINIATSSLSAASTTLYTFPLDASTGYTGFKADYTLTNLAETSKKVGTLLGSWDRAGNPVINDSYTLATGNVTATAFSITSDSTSALLKLGVTSGTFELNMLVTAFKRSI